MSQRKPQIYESKNTILSRSSEPIKRFQNKMNVLNQPSPFPSIRLIKQTESSLMKENQAFYKFKYTLQDNSDETNTVFFDANSRKFRTRSVKPQHPNKFKDSYNKISSFKSGQKYMKTKDYTSPNRSNCKISSFKLYKKFIFMFKKFKKQSKTWRKLCEYGCH